MRQYILSTLAVFLLAIASVSASTVYNSIGNPLPGSYPSQPFEAQQVAEFGDQVQLAGTDRLLTTVNVTMTDWACGNDFTWTGSAWVANRSSDMWNVNGAKQLTFVLDGDSTLYTHDFAAVDTNGVLSGNGGYPAGGPFTYAWTVTSGSVSGSTIDFYATYTAGAVGTTMHVTGTIAADGSMSGTWSDNFGGSRTGTWSAPAGTATQNACVTTPGTGFTHPITLNLYATNPANASLPGALLATKTVSAFIKFRPSYNPLGNCTAPAADVPFGGTYYDAVTGLCSHGYNTVITFDFTGANITLPDQVVYGVAYNTGDYGKAPIGANGPYNSLNVAVNDAAPTIGTDVDNNAAFVNYGYAPFYCDGGAGGIGTFRLDAGCWAPYTPAVAFSAITPAIVKHDCSGKNDGKDKNGKQDKDCKNDDKKDDHNGKGDDHKNSPWRGSVHHFSRR